MRTVFFILILAIFLGANYYVFYRLYKMMPPIPAARIILIAIGVLLVVSIFVFFLLRNSIPDSLATVVYTMGTSWIFIFLYFLMAFLLLDLLRVTHLLPVQKIMYESWPGFIGVVGVIAIIMILGYTKYYNKERVNLDIAVNKEVPLPMSSLKIVAISDLHLGYTIKRSEFESWVNLINKENPDIILIAGDAIDNNLEPVRNQKMEEVFKQMKSRYGVFIAPGNHEYISGIKESLEFFRDAGVHVLRDSAQLIDNSFYVVGRDDRSNTERKELAELTGVLDKSKPVILLDHQPYYLDKAEENKIDLQISGHTHHGQVWPISWITNAIYEKSHGYLKKGNTHIYVSSGIGLWGGKFRIGTQSEYVVINLTFTPAN